MTASYLLTLSSDTPNMPRFLKSLSFLDGSVEHLAVQFTPYTVNMKTYQIYDKPYPGNLSRFHYVPDNLDKERYILFSDTDDVIFQKKLPQNLSFDIYLACENEVHINSYWSSYLNRYPQFLPLKNREIYNAGVFLAKVEVFYQYVDFLKNCLVQYHKDNVKEENLDQLYFNLFLCQNPHLSKAIDLSFFCPLYANYEKGLCFKDKDGWWKTKKGDIIICVHANGNYKNVL